MNLISRIIIFLFFLIVLLTGLFCYKDYGLSFDEEMERLTGLVTLKYLLELFYPSGLNSVVNINNIPALASYIDRIYSPHFQLICIFFKKLLNVKGTRDTFLLSHLINFLVFYLGVIFFYKTLKERFNNWKPALLGATMLVLSPRIFADAFYNSKDIVFMTACIICTYTFFKYINNKSIKYLVLHAICSALTIDIRFMGLIFPILTLTFIFFVNFRGHKFQGISAAIIYLGLVVSFTILFWPYLWENPLTNYLAIFNKLDRDGAIGYVLFNGQTIPFNQLPWYYVPTWIFITTPVIYTCLFIISHFFLLKIYRKDISLKNSTCQDILAYILFYTPLLAVIFMNAILYDGWRHLFFIYPFFLYIAVKGYVEFDAYLSKLKALFYIKGTSLFLGAIVLSLFLTSYSIIQHHPFQNVYFNFLVNTDNMHQKFDLDYWGLSYRQALEYLLKHDTKSEINYAAENLPGGLNLEILPESQRSRLNFVPIEEATYFLTEYRSHPLPYPYENEIHSIKVDGMKIMSIFKISKRLEID